MLFRRNKFIADVIENKCSNCSRCVQTCRHRALETALVQGKTVTFLNAPQRCTGCGKCVAVCPNQAIEMIERYC